MKKYAKYIYIAIFIILVSCATVHKVDFHEVADVAQGVLNIYDDIVSDSEVVD